MFKKAYDTRSRNSFTTTGPSVTQQNFKKECDINNILAKYQRTGLVEHVSRFHGDYKDLSDPVDYQTALNVVIAGQDAFNSLPSSVRKRFGNDPEEFLTFVMNPENKEELYDMGLANRPVNLDQALLDQDVSGIPPVIEPAS